jgi:hypothetical protein
MRTRARRVDKEKGMGAYLLGLCSFFPAAIAGEGKGREGKEKTRHTDRTCTYT